MHINYDEMFKATLGELPEQRKQKEEEFRVLFGENFLKYLNNANISIKSLSHMTGYDQQHFYGFRKGKAPSLFCLYRICNALNVSAEFLWDFDNVLNDSSDDIVEKRALLANKIANINDSDLLDKLISEIEFYSKRTSSPIINEDVFY